MVLVFFLLLVNGTTTTHVGNFKTMADCQAAAQASSIHNPRNLSFGPIFICVQANNLGLNPPPN